LIATAFIMLIILGIQAPPLILYRKWWDLAVFLAFWSGATAYTLLVVARAGIPTPTEIITAMVNLAFRLIPGN